MYTDCIRRIDRSWELEEEYTDCNDSIMNVKS